MAPHPASQLHLKHFRLIVAIAEHGQLSIAAHSLAMTQPAASRTLAEAEARIGTALFDRHPHGMTPTVVGEGLARRARNIFQELNDAADEVERLQQGREGVVRIGAVSGAAVGYVVPAIRHLKNVAPEVEVHVDVDTSDSLMTGLVALRHDMILGRLAPQTDSGRLDLLRAKGEQVLIVTKETPAHARTTHVGLADLSDHEWVLQGPGAPLRRAVEEAFLDQGALFPAKVTNTASLVMTIAMLRNPGTVTAVSREVAHLLVGSQSDLKVLPVRGEITVSPYSLMTLRDRRLSPVAARCRDILATLVAGDRERAND